MRRSSPRAIACACFRLSWGRRGSGRRRVRRLRGARRREPLMPLAVCATPIGNLDDVTLRLLAELRGRARALRGHPRDASCSSGTGSRRGCSATTSTTRRSASRRCSRGSRAGSGSRSSRTRAPGRERSRRAARRGCARRRRAGDGAAGAVGRRDRARRGGARRRALPVRRVPAPRRACAALALEELARWPHAVVAFESPQRLPRSPRSPPFSPSGRRPSVAS